MKREMIAAALLLVMVIVCAVNTAAFTSLTDDVIACLDRCSDLLREGKSTQAYDALDTAQRRWRAADGYVSVILDDSVSDMITEGFNRLSFALSEGNTSGALECCIRLEELIIGIVRDERPSPGSIL